MKKLISFVVSWVPARNGWANTSRVTCSNGTLPLRRLIRMILLTGVCLPKFALANCEGTGPCYCDPRPGLTSCTNTPPPSNSSGGSSGGGITPGQQILIQGIGNAIGNALRGDPEADAKRQAEADRAAALQRQADEQRKEEEQRQLELSKQRILGALKGTESSSDLRLKTDSDSTQTVTETREAFGSTVVTPTRIDSPPAEHGLQLKLGDDADRGSMQARQGFDTAGSGSKLPPPPAPTTRSPAEKAQLLNALRAKLQKNETDEQLLKNQLAQLQQAPTFDTVAINQVQQQIVVKETEKKKIMRNMTAEDPDSPGTN